MNEKELFSQFISWLKNKKEDEPKETKEQPVEQPVEEQVEEKENTMNEKELKELEELRQFKEEAERNTILEEAKAKIKEIGYNDEQTEALVTIIDPTKIEDALEKIKSNIFKVDNPTVVTDLDPEPSVDKEDKLSKEELQKLFDKI